MSQSEIQIRPATRYDKSAVARLGRLNHRRLGARALVAEDGGEIVAAIDLTSGAVVGDPARLTPEVVPALRRRRYELLRQGGSVRHARFALAPRFGTAKPLGDVVRATGSRVRATWPSPTPAPAAPHHDRGSGRAHRPGHRRRGGGVAHPVH